MNENSQFQLLEALNLWGLRVLLEIELLVSFAFMFVIYSLYSIRLHTRKFLITCFMKIFDVLCSFHFINSLAEHCVVIFTISGMNISSFQS